MTHWPIFDFMNSQKVFPTPELFFWDFNKMYKQFWKANKRTQYAAIAKNKHKDLNGHYCREKWESMANQGSQLFSQHFFLLYAIPGTE